jgi:carbon monoxide dehydrogenase subunit G
VTLTPDTVEGDYQGMHLGMKVAERIPTSRIVMKPMEGFPMDFTLLFDIENTSATTSKLKVSIEAQMNFLMKAMLGRKIQSVLDQITDQIASRGGI